LFRCSNPLTFSLGGPHEVSSPSSPCLNNDYFSVELPRVLLFGPFFATVFNCGFHSTPAASVPGGRSPSLCEEDSGPQAAGRHLLDIGSGPLKIFSRFEFSLGGHFGDIRPGTPSG